MKKLALICLLGLSIGLVGCGQKGDKPTEGYTLNQPHYESSSILSLGDYKNLTYDYIETDLSEQDLEEQMKIYTEGNTTYVDITDRIDVQEGDSMFCNVNVYHNNKEEEGYQQVGKLVNLTEDYLPDDVKTALIGKNVGDIVEVETTIHDNVYFSSLDGETVTFKIEILSLQEKQTSELTDEYAQQIGYDSLEDLTSNMEINVQYDKAIEAKNTIDTELMDKLIEESTYDITDEDIQTYFDFIIDYTTVEASYNNQTYDEYMEANYEDPDATEALWKEDCVNEIKRELTLKELLEQEGINIDKIYKKEAKQIALDQGYSDTENLEFYYGISGVKDLIYEEKGIEILETYAKAIDKDGNIVEDNVFEKYKEAMQAFEEKQEQTMEEVTTTEDASSSTN